MKCPQCGNQMALDKGLTSSIQKSEYECEGCGKSVTGTNSNQRLEKNL